MFKQYIVLSLVFSLLNLGYASIAASQPILEATCQKGLYKCAERSKDAAEYWGCMRFECKAEDAHTAKPDCDVGVIACQAFLYKYDSCIRAVCGGIDTSCTAAETRCGIAASAFHQCTQQACLGSLQASYKAVEDATQQEALRYQLRSQRAMQAIDPAASPAYLNRTPGGLPSRFLVCPGGGQKYCVGNDSHACICTNGRPPINVLQRPVSQIMQLEKNTR